MVIGSFSALIALTGRIGKQHKVEGVITRLNTPSSLEMVAVDIKLSKQWPGHRGGQFCYLTSSEKEGAHPYTIASSCDSNEQMIKVIIKELGDWTGQLKDWLKVDMKVTLEGPYRNFTFDDDCSSQIWIGAGIGITPFVAKMGELAQQNSHKQIDLFYITSSLEAEVENQLKADASAANINLHIHPTSEFGRLSVYELQQTIPTWQASSY